MALTLFKIHPDGNCFTSCQVRKERAIHLKSSFQFFCPASLISIINPRAAIPVRRAFKCGRQTPAKCWMRKVAGRTSQGGQTKSTPIVNGSERPNIGGRFHKAAQPTSLPEPGLLVHEEARSHDPYRAERIAQFVGSGLFHAQLASDCAVLWSERKRKTAANSSGGGSVASSITRISKVQSSARRTKASSARA